MNNDYIDNTLEVIAKVFKDKKKENTEQYEKLEEIIKRRKGKTNEK